MARKSTDIVALTLRLREDLRRKLERAADKAERSLNIEIVERLEASFAAEEKARDQKQMLAKLEEIEGRVFKGMEETKSMIEQANASYAEWFQKFLRQEGK